MLTIYVTGCVIVQLRTTPQLFTNKWQSEYWWYMDAG